MSKGRLISLAEYCFFLLLRLFVYFLPFPYVFYFAAFVFSYITHLLYSSLRKGVLSRLSFAFDGALDSTRLWHVSRDVFISAGYSIFELLSLVGISDKAFRRRFVFEEASLRLLYDNMALGRGLVLASGHYGNWEVMGKAIASLGFVLNAIYRPLDNVYLDRYLYKLRSSYPVGMIAKNEAYYKGSRALSRGEIVLFLVDQNQKEAGVSVRFFAKDVLAPKGPSILAYRKGAPILFAWSERMGHRHVISFKKLNLDYDLCYSEFIYRVTQDFTYMLERLIRKSPVHWWWFHDRWKQVE